MRKQVFGRQFKRDANERKALFKNLMSELILHEQITTTAEKAKAIRASVEKLITRAKKDKQQAHMLLQAEVNAHALKKLLEDLGSRFANRPGGYTRIMKLQRRFNDNAQMVIMELVEKGSSVEGTGQKTKGKKETKGTVENTVAISKGKPAKKAKGEEKKEGKKPSSKKAVKEKKENAK